MANKILTPDTRALAEERATAPAVHHAPSGFSDRFALGFTKLLRFTADTFFAKRYGHRAIVLETVAAVQWGASADQQYALMPRVVDERVMRALHRFRLLGSCAYRACHE